MSVPKLFNLTGEVALITGAGRGIGREIALTFADAGADIICVARTRGDIEDCAEQCRSRGVRALALDTDISKDAQRAKMVNHALAALGKISILVNNAGGAYPNDPMKTATDQLDRDFHFNVSSAFHLIQLCQPELAKYGGNVINISSAAARYAQKGFSNYGTVKAALSQMTRLLAADFAPQVRVNGIAPGSILTDALSQFLDQETQAKMSALTPMARLGTPQNIAAAALYLASPAAAWVTGKILEIDGGAESTTWPF